MQPHSVVLSCIQNLEFNYGKNLIADTLLGQKTPRVIEKKLDTSPQFAALSIMDRDRVLTLIDSLIQSGYLELKTFSTNKFAKVIHLTHKGEQEIHSPKGLIAINEEINPLTDKDKEQFKILGPALEGLSEEQKKAVIDNSPQILCIAGAGSGKTRALTRRISFLAKYKSIPQNKILAITFTRKARREMEERLSNLLPNNKIRIETFNSFAEKELKRFGSLIYHKPYKVMTYADKFAMLAKIANEEKIDIDELIELYFSKHTLRSKERRTLHFMLINDIMAVLDYYAFTNKNIKDITSTFQNLDYRDKKRADLLNLIIQRIPQYKREHGLRDFTDQLVHLNKLYKKFPDTIPEFDHVLVDEYQDVNNLQIKTLDLLKPKNIFVVGDPRQSIFGWRGSKVSHILSFREKYKDCSIIQLVDNYRSGPSIVEFMNTLIQPMQFSNLSSKQEEQAHIQYKKFDSDQQEAVYVAQEILKSKTPRSEIFVLARTNKQIDILADALSILKIPFIKRTLDELNPPKEQKENQVLLSTVHAAKGLEADLVFMVGVNANQYPCIASDHPIIDAIKADDDYDKFSEEHRLLYVGVSRARKNLIITNTTAITSFFSPDILKTLGIQSQQSLKHYKTIQKFTKTSTPTSTQSKIYATLKEYRLETAKLLGIRPYMVFSDKTLTELCESLPMTLIELQEVYGFGSTKINRFGRDIIEIVKKFS